MKKKTTLKHTPSLRKEKNVLKFKKTKRKNLHTHTYTGTTTTTTTPHTHIYISDPQVLITSNTGKMSVYLK